MFGDRHFHASRLVAHLRTPDAAVEAHLRGCAPCRERLARVAEGLRAVDEAAHRPLPSVNWDAMEGTLRARLAAEPEVSRAPAPGSTAWWKFGGAGLVAAMVFAALVLFRPSAGTLPAVPAVPVATAPAAAPRAPRVPSLPETVAAPTVQPAVVALTGPAVLVRAGAQTVSGEGQARTEVQTQLGGRMVLALGSSGTSRLDVRELSDVEISTRPAGVLVDLRRGKVRVDVADASQPLRIQAGRVLASCADGALVAENDESRVSLRVLSGETLVRVSGGAAVELAKGTRLSVALDSGEITRTPDDAADAEAVDTSYAAPSGRDIAFHGVPSGARMWADGKPLPRDPRSVRIARPVQVRCEGAVPAETVIGPGDAVGPSWRPPRAVTPPSVPGAATRSPDAGPAPPTVPSRPMSVDDQVHARVTECLRGCAAGAACALSEVALAVDTNPGGTVADVRVSGVRETSARACIEHGVRQLRLPATTIPDTYHFAVAAP